MRDLIYVILLLVVAGLIGYGFDAVFSSLLPQNAASTFIKPFALGIRPLSIHISVCGILGVICSYMLMKFIFRR